MMEQTHWQPATLAAALGVPEEAFRAFARLRQTAWEKELSPPEAASLALGRSRSQCLPWPECRGCWRAA
jgi:hypothetical protein